MKAVIILLLAISVTHCSVFRVIGFSDPALDQLVKSINKEARLTIINNSLVIDGYCNRCQLIFDSPHISCTKRMCHDGRDKMDQFLVEVISQPASLKKLGEEVNSLTEVLLEHESKKVTLISIS